MTKKDGGPAFPTDTLRHREGMSLRDYYAGKALVLANQDMRDGPMDALAAACYAMADAMIAEREK